MEAGRSKKEEGRRKQEEGTRKNEQRIILAKCPNTVLGLPRGRGASWM